MKWKGRRGSDNVRDRRGRSTPSGGAPIGALVNLALRLFGVKGVLALAAIGLLGVGLGVVDPATLLGGGNVGADSAYRGTAQEQERYEFVRVVLADTEDIWTQEFSRLGREYRQPVLEVYTSQTKTACGPGNARMGPFYCPADRTIYIDLGFYDELAQQFDAPGDFAQAYVIAHEVGHHIQNLLGISRQVAARRGQPDYNQLSVRLELQADYLAGMWAKRNARYLETGDIEEAMRAANQIGDDAIQRRSQGRVVPHAFTHGTSEQRMRWFNRGLELGSMEGADTFALAYDAL
ncbi:MAG: neutral zinc metallopeptidase [Pseudomonadota bacterium]